MSDLLEQIASYLQTQGVAQGYGTDVFGDFVPNDPDKVILLMEYASAPGLATVEALDRRIQINCRGTSASEAKSLAWSVYKVFWGTGEIVRVDIGDRWCTFQPIQAPFKLKEDENGRTLYVFNMAVISDPEY